MSRWQIGFAASLILLSSAVMAQTVPPTGEMPGLIRAILEPVTPEESERFIRSRPVPADLVSPQPEPSLLPGAPRAAGATAPTGPASIAELARALKNDPDLIYEYVRNNIEFYPVYGMQKGAVGAILDGQGTALDQVDLMVALLRQAGFTANYMKGIISLNAAQVGEWLRVDTGNACAVGNLIARGGIPITSISATGPSDCSLPLPPPVALTNLKITHFWVEVIIGGTPYYFDPSYKPHTIKTGINLAAASGYNAVTYLTQARSGATITADTIRGANRANIRNNLTTYATTLANYLRANLPAATLDDAIGGMTIVAHAGGNLRQSALSYQTGTPAMLTAAQVDAHKPILTIAYRNAADNATILSASLRSDAIYGKRLTITYNASHQPVLMLDGAILVTGTAIPIGTESKIIFTAAHPYAITNNNAIEQYIKEGGTYLIGNGWGPAGRGVIELHRRRLEEARAAGISDASEVVLGSSLAVLSSTWIAQLATAGRIGDQLNNANTLYHHMVGIAGYTTAAYVDLPGNLFAFVSRSADKAKEINAFYNLGTHLSILESVAVQQTSGIGAVSTVKLIDIAAINNDWIYSATSGNYASIENLLVNCSVQQKSGFLGAINQTLGNRLILPGRCGLGEGDWTGVGYFVADSASTRIGAIINGALGGFSTFPQSASDYAKASFANTWNPYSMLYSSRTFGDPIDMARGDYLYSNDDMKVGVGDFPHALTFQKLYTSSARLQAGPLGKGWSHNFASSVTVGSDAFQGMGEDSALDAVNTLVEMMVSLDLMSDAAKPLDKLVFATLGQRWYGDQLLDNTVIVRQGLNGEVFVKLPDGTYNPPPGNPARLILNPDTTYTYETLTRDRLNFNTAGKLATYNHASGLQVKFTYTGADLSQVQNSLGRTLTLTNVSGRITAVGDGTRSIGYGCVSGNLQTFTDADAKVTTFNYDVPGRLFKIFYPANPTNPAVTNVYDTLGRVQTQTNANDKLYTYYFAGSRSEEVGPYSTSNVSYVDAFGKVLKAINPLGKVTLNTYDGQERLVKTVLPEGNSVTYAYDDAPCAAVEKRCTHNVKTLSRIPKAGSPLATQITGMTYASAFNKVASVTDPKGYVTNYTYTAQGDPLTITRPADIDGIRPYTTYAYTGYMPSGYSTFYLPTSVTFNATELVAVTNTTGYNSANKYVPLTTIADSGTGKLNLTTTYTYDAVGNLTVVNGPRTDVTDTVTTGYDSERRPAQVTDARGKLTRLAYDADGNLIRTSAQIGALWMVSCKTYTLSGKLLKAWGPGQTAAHDTCPVAAAPVAVTDYAYDDQDRLLRTTENLTVAEGGNRVTETVYYLDGRVQNVKRAVGNALAQTTAAYTYTNNGLPNTVKDAKNNLTTYQYDGHDRLAKTLFPDKVTPNTSSATDYEQHDYDDNNNPVITRKRSGQTVINDYDALDRVTSRNYPDPDDTITFRYDMRGRITSAYTSGHGLGYLFDNAGRLSSVYLNGNLNLSYQYDAAGNRTRITWPEATPFYVTTTYDELNRPWVMKELNTTNLATYAYDDLSRRMTVTLGNGTTTGYGYNTQSALSSLAHNLAGTAQDNTWTYTRNQAQEILTNTAGTAAYQWAGYANGTKAYTPNGLNQYTAAAGATLGYDANGNLSSDGTWTYGYDQDNRLKTANKTGLAASLVYDGLGRLRQTTIAGTATKLLYDGTDLVAEYDGNNALLRRYVHGPGIDEPLVWYEGAGTGSKTWLYGDHQGSVAATANSAGTSTATYTYGPFGEPNNPTGIRFRYTGQQWLSQLGLYHYKARFYSPTLGRFLQTDPVGYQSDLNLYAYVGNDPVNGIDPDGNIAQFFVLPAIGGLINAGFEGFGAGQAGGSGYEIAAAAGKGFISGFAGTAAGLITKFPAVSGAINGAVDEVVKSGLNGKIPSLADVGKAAGRDALLGKFAERALPLKDASVDFIFKTPPASNLNANLDAARRLDQTIGTGLAGGGVQTVGGFIKSLPKP